MKFTSLFTRLGLLALGFILVAVLKDVTFRKIPHFYIFPTNKASTV